MAQGRQLVCIMPLYSPRFDANLDSALCFASMSARTSPIPTLPQLAAEDEAAVRELANELYGLAIASRSECLIIAMDLFDAGCPSLGSLLECPSISTIEELQTELGTLKNVQLNHLQLRRIVNWIQRQRQTLAPDSDVGSKRMHPSAFLPLAAMQHVRRLEASDASTVAVLPERAADGSAARDVSTEIAAAKPAAADLAAVELAAAELVAAEIAGRIEDEARTFTEMM